MFFKFFIVFLSLFYAHNVRSQNKSDINLQLKVEGEPLEAIVAIVGDELVLLSEVQKAVQVVSSGQSKVDGFGVIVGGSIEVADAQSLFEQLINEKVLAIKVKEFGLQVTDEELETEFDNNLKQQNLSKEKFLEILANEGETYENYMEVFRRQLETRRLIGRSIRGGISVTDDEVKNFYFQQPNVNKKQQRVRLSSLVISVSDSLTEAQKSEKLNRVEKVKQEVSHPNKVSIEDFNKLIKLYSDDFEIGKSEGVLEPKPIDALPALVQEKLLAKPVIGEVIGPIKLGSTYFFFQYLESIYDSSDEFEKKKDYWKNMLLETKTNERLLDFIKIEKSRIKITRRNFVFSKR